MSQRAIINSFFALLFILLQTTALAKIQDSNLQFTYIVNEMDLSLPCTHFQENQEPNYWKVKCSNGEQLTKEYKIYFNIRTAQNLNAKTQAYEFLYFINDRNQKSPAFSSQGTWLHLKSLSDLQALTLDLSLENDYSFLRLNFTSQDIKITDLEASPKKKNLLVH